MYSTGIIELLSLSLLLGLGLIPAFIAQKKGRSFFTWYIYGVLLFMIALIHSFCINSNDKAKFNEGLLVKCPFCAEFIKSEAKICRYCGRDIV